MEPRFRTDFAIVWRELRQGKPVDLAQIGADLYEREGVGYWAKCLREAGYVAQKGTEIRLLDPVCRGVLPPLLRGDRSLYDPNRGGWIELWQLRAWRSLLQLPGTSLESLAAHAEVHHRNLAVYLRTLADVRWARARGRAQERRWWATKTEFVPPLKLIEGGVQRLYDPNTCEYLEAPHRG